MKKCREYEEEDTGKKKIKKFALGGAAKIRKGVVNKKMESDKSFRGSKH